MVAEKNRRVIVMSIKPEFSQQIFEGTKMVEFRKVMFREPLSDVVVYESGRTRKIVGHFQVNEIVRDVPASLWKSYGQESGISKLRFCQYFSGYQSGVAILIGKVYKYIKPIDFVTLKSILRVPQSFAYISQADFKKCVSYVKTETRDGERKQKKERK